MVDCVHPWVDAGYQFATTGGHRAHKRCQDGPVKMTMVIYFKTFLWEALLSHRFPKAAVRATKA